MPRKTFSDGVQRSQIPGKVHEASLIWTPPLSPSPSPRRSLAALPLSHSSLPASSRRDVIFPCCPWSGSFLPCPTSPLHPLPTPLCLPTELNLTLEDKLGFLFRTLFFWNMPSLHLTVLSLHYLIITLLTSWPPPTSAHFIYFFFSFA